MPSAAAEPVVFATAVEGVRRAFGKRLKPAALITNYRRGVLEKTLVRLGVDGELELLEVDAGQPSARFRITWR